MDLNSSNSPNSAFEEANFDECLQNSHPEQKEASSKKRKKIQILQREAQLIEKQRKKLRLFSPAEVYFYRHTSFHWSHSVLHAVTLFISVAVILLGLFFSVVLSYQQIPGLGSFSNITWWHLVWLYALYEMSLKRCKTSKNKCLPNRKVYKMAVIANSFNRAVLHLAIGLALFELISKYFKSGYTIPNVLNSSWLFLVFSLVVLVIFQRAFRFCNKEITA